MKKSWELTSPADDVLNKMKALQGNNFAHHFGKWDDVELMKGNF